MYEWQEEAIQELKNKNAILAAPTGAGKTKVAYEWSGIREAIQTRGHTVYYTVPIKALANEKYNELSSLYGEDSVGVVTGDVTINPKAAVLVCTQEVFTKAFRNQDNGRLVVDEFHYIFQNDGRSRAYIDGIKTSMPSLLLSATFGDPGEVAKYLKRITGKKFAVYETDYRPTSLQFLDRVYTVNDLAVLRNVLVYIFNTKVAKTLARAICEYRKPNIARQIRLNRLANKYKVSDLVDTLPYGVAIYHGKLQYNEKIFLEDCVRNRLIDTVIATSALGVGVNFPFETVLFASFKVPAEELGTFRPLSKTEFLQMAGRAGRPGYYDTGYVGVLAHSFLFYESPSEIRAAWIDMLQAPLEKPAIKLSVDIERLIANPDPETEVQYIAQNSLPQLSEDEVSKLRLYVETICRTLSGTDTKTLGKFYTPELTLNENIALMGYLEDRDSFYSSEIAHFCNDRRGHYYSTLKLYRVCKHLRRVGLKVNDMDTLIKRIQAMDPWVLLKTQNGEQEVLI